MIGPVWLSGGCVRPTGAVRHDACLFASGVTKSTVRSSQLIDGAFESFTKNTINTLYLEFRQFYMFNLVTKLNEVLLRDSPDTILFFIKITIFKIHLNSFIWTMSMW